MISEMKVQYSKHIPPVCLELVSIIISTLLMLLLPEIHRNFVLDTLPVLIEEGIFISALTLAMVLVNLK